MRKDSALPDAPRYVFCERPRCPLCDSVRLAAYRSDRSDDGSVARRVRCRECGAKFILVLE